MRNNDLIITRATIGQIASFIGAAGLLSLVLVFLWRNGFDAYSTAPLIAAIGGILVWAIATPDEFRNFITGRQVRYGTSAVFSTFLMIGIVVMIYVVVERAVITLDMTESGSFTLTNTTTEIIERVNRPVQIIGFYSPGLVTQQEIDDQFYRLYETASEGMITRRYIDPDEQPALAQSYNARDGDVFLAYVNDEGEPDFTTIQFVTDTGTQERDMTQALSRLLLSGSITVYFDLSLGELDPLDNSASGLSIINQLIRENGLITQPLTLEGLATNGDPIPADATVIILARPRIDPSPEAIQLLDDYLQNGGSLFILADTQSDFMTQDSPFNTYMWENYGLRMFDAVVVDSGASGETELDIISAIIFESEISAGIDPTNDPESATQFRIARPIEVNEEPPVANGRIIMSSQDSFGETNLESLFQENTYFPDPGEDIPGPLTTVAFADDRANGGARILLIGDSDFITNGQITSPLGNAYLFTDGLGWLTDFNNQVTFTPEARTTNIPIVFISAQQLDQIAFLTVILIPGIVLASGIFVWFRRSRR